MEIDHFSSNSKALNFNTIHEVYGSTQEEFEFQVKHSFSGMELLEEINTHPTDNRKGSNLFKDQDQQQQQQQEQLKVDNLILEEVNFDSDQPFQEAIGLKNQIMATSELVEYNKQVKPSLASLELLRNYGSRSKRLNKQSITNNNNLTNIEASLDQQKYLSAEEIIRVAGARYVQYSAQYWNANFCIPMHPYGMDSYGLCEEENRDIELAQFLLAAAEKVGCQQFERASRFLLHCQWNSSATGNPLQRVVFHFAQALRERIDKETGRVITLKGYEKNEERELCQKMDIKMSLIGHKNVPFNQVMQFTGIQAIVEHDATETKIHVIDLDIRSGVQYTALMQALAERQDWIVEILKITTIGIVAYETKVEETGKRLTSFAESLNLPFSYKAVFVTDIAEIMEDHFEIEEDEAVAVYSPYFLRYMISRPSFVNRFIEALFFYSAFFDCLETCIKEENECRLTTEAILSEGIRNIVAMEGRERTVRNVKIDVWRRFFARYRMVETGFSESSLYQANLVANEFASGKFSTIDKNGKCLIVGWKGTPMFSLSAWRFL